MLRYFSMLETEASTGKKYSSILELTRDLANGAGYHRGCYRFKNKNIRERTLYTRKFDSVLTAKWMCFYKKLFINKLNKHPELKEYHVQIIDKTFFMFMGSLNLSKISDDAAVTKYVDKTLFSRIADAMYYEKPRYSLVPFQYNKNEKRKFRYTGAIDKQTLSLNDIKDEIGDKFDIEYMSDEDGMPDDLVLLLSSKLDDNPYGGRMLDAMLYSDRKLKLSKIDEYMLINDNEKTDETKKYLIDAYNVIKKYMAENYRCGHQFKKSNIRTIHFK